MINLSAPQASNFSNNTACIGYGSSPQSSWHQEPVSWRTIFLQMRAGVMIQAVTQAMVQAVIRVMGSGRRSFARSPTIHLLLCSPVPNRLWTNLGVGEPWIMEWLSSGYFLNICSILSFGSLLCAGPPEDLSLEALAAYSTVTFTQCLLGC